MWIFDCGVEGSAPVFLFFLLHFLGVHVPPLPDVSLKPWPLTPAVKEEAPAYAHSRPFCCEGCCNVSTWSQRPSVQSASRVSRVRPAIRKVALQAGA